jgi:hypothetical protein
MYKTQSTFKTYRCDTCNIQKKINENFKHTSKTLAKTCEKHMKIIAIHTQHVDKTITTYV